MNGIMNEEPLDTPLSGTGPGVKQQCTEGTKTVPETSTAAESPDVTSRDCGGDAKESSPSVAVKLSIRETNQAAVVGVSEPSVDWFEPLEEDDDGDGWDYAQTDKHNGKRDAEEESLAGESEMSGSVGGSDKTYRKTHQYPRHHSRRKRTTIDEGWEDWPDLGQGWKRREVVRSSGNSVGKTDVYYLGPKGERVRSKVELITVLEGVLDVTMFEFKTGKFSDRLQPQRRGRKKMREHSSSESSWLERGEGAETPDPHPRLAPGGGSKLSHGHSNSLSLTVSMDHTYRMKGEVEGKAAVSLTTVPLPCIDRQSEGPTLICARCGISFIGTLYDQQRKKPSCPKCWDLKAKEHPMIRHRKWFPCGKCVACCNTVNCGQCASCRHALQSPNTRKRICRKRKCLCPLRKMREPAIEVTSEQGPLEEEPETTETNVSPKVIQNIPCTPDDSSKSTSVKWIKRRKRRTCGKCVGCLVKRDCGICDFCTDKPKFGGRNTKRQKCRLRQCKKQSLMRYTFSGSPAQDTAQQSSFEVSDEDADYNLQPVSQTSYEVADDGNLHAISQTSFEVSAGDYNLHAVNQTSFGDGDRNLHTVRQTSFAVAGVKDGDHVLQPIEVLETQHNQSYQDSDAEDFSVNLDEVDEEDMSTDDDDDWHKKRKRRTCGSCEGCQVPRDCGTCDFCADKPKFGGSNKKRQKCRLRQCQRQAMLASAEYQESLALPGRPKPLYTYSRKTAKKSRQSSTEAADGEDGNDTPQTMYWNLEPTVSKHVYEMSYGIGRSPIQNQPSRHSADWATSRDVEMPFAEDNEEFPMITKIFSLADDPVSVAADTDGGLVRLLGALRMAAMPVIWYPIMAAGPQLQLVQCSKRSSMADTAVEVHPGFTYQVTVQRQPLLPTHPLYRRHPPRLSAPPAVVSLLMDLETYEVCQGVPPLTGQDAGEGPIIFERAATCDFLIHKDVKSCDNCRALYE